MPRPLTATLPASAETAVLRAVQRTLDGRGVLVAARSLSLFGEHAAGWLALGAVGAATNRARRRHWLAATAAVAGAHGAAIGLKRLVRRTRPEHPDITVHVATPSRLSFPSSHASSTTAAALLFGALSQRRSMVAVVPVMMLSRLVLGVHYPSDVLAGSALGALIGTAARRWITGGGPR